MQESSKTVTTDRRCPTCLGGETRKISLLGTGTHAVSVSCCPIEIGRIEVIKSLPDDTANEGEHAGDTSRMQRLFGGSAM